MLCADEPTGELDSETTLEVISYLKEINDNFGTTMLVVTHGHRFERLTQKTYRILDGHIGGIRRSINSKIVGDWKNVNERSWHLLTSMEMSEFLRNFVK